MNQEPDVAITSESNSHAVITPWLSGCLVVSLVGGAIFSGMLIFGEGGFNATQRQAQAAQHSIESSRIELAALKNEVNALIRTKTDLAPIVSDFEQRLKEKTAAEAALTALEDKQRQAQTEFTALDKRLKQANMDLLSLLMQRTDVTKEIEQLRAELTSSTKTAADAQAKLHAQLEHLKGDRDCLAAEIGELNSRKSQILAATK